MSTSTAFLKMSSNIYQAELLDFNACYNFTVVKVVDPSRLRYKLTNNIESFGCLVPFGLNGVNSTFGRGFLFCINWGGANTPLTNLPSPSAWLEWFLEGIIFVFGTYTILYNFGLII